MKAMNRRRFLAASGAAAGLLAAPPNNASQRPNILWFVVDDMSPHLACYGEALIQTPHLDRLAREGTRFAHAYVTSPVCSPCRSAMITGRYQTSIHAHHHRSGRGVVKNRLPEDVDLLPALFQRAGYFTCIGSGLPGRNHAGRPIQTRNAKGQPAHQTLLGKTDYNFEWDPKVYDSHDWANRQPGQPFFMQVHLHGGKMREGSQQAVETFKSRISDAFGGRTDPEAVTLPPYYPRDPVLLEDWALYLDAVRLTDRLVGETLNRLETEGILDSTLIIFMADHGISHARGKQFLYDEGTRIPFIMRGPGAPRGAVRDDLVAQIDMAAVSLAAAGLPVPAGMQGRDILAPDYAARDAVFAARDRCDETVDRIRSARDNRFLYIRNGHPRRPHLQPNAYKDAKPILKTLRSLHAEGRLDSLSARLLFAPERAPEELYDWRADPFQTNNLAMDPACRDVLAALRARLDRWAAETGDPGPEPEAMFESDMAVYLEAQRGNPIIANNLNLMRQWAREGR